MVSRTLYTVMINDFITAEATAIEAKGKPQ
jgi:hypothetical protein